LIPKKIIIHCTASKNGEPYPAAQINKDHIARGFTKIGYHVVFQPDGSVEIGRGFNEQGAHCSGENDDSIGLSLVGTDKFTSEQFDSLRYQMDGILLCYPTIHKSEIHCHYEYKSAQEQGKTCPNISLSRLLCWYFTGDETAISPYKIDKTRLL
jgi:N-acetylmuramoyl-L-alanine amidase